MLHKHSLFAIFVLSPARFASLFPGGPKWQVSDGVLDHIALLGKALTVPSSLVNQDEHRVNAWLPDLTCSVGMDGTTVSIQDLCRLSTSECFDEIRERFPEIPSINPKCPFDKAVRYMRQHCYALEGNDSPSRSPPEICNHKTSKFQTCYETHAPNQESFDKHSKFASALQRLDDAFSFTRLSSLFELHGGLEATQGAYRKWDPFPYMVFDKMLPWEVLEQMQLELPSLSVCDLTALSALGWRQAYIDPSWHWLKWTLPLVTTTDNNRIPPDSIFGPVGRALLGHLRGQPFISFLEQLTGIGPLIADPYLFGGGLHETVRGGYLGLHIDFSRHPVYENFERRVNVFFFLSPQDWSADWGGALELWREEAGGSAIGGCAVRILPNGGRMVIFSTSPRSLHGHPWPLDVPENETRRSLALYYYKPAGPGRWYQQEEPTWSGETYVADVQCTSPEDPKCYGSAVTV